RGLQFIFIRNETFYSDDELTACHTRSAKRFGFGARPDLKIVVSLHETAVQDLKIKITFWFGKPMIALTLKPNAVVIAAMPGFGVPTKLSVFSLWLKLEDISQNKRIPLLVFDRMRPIFWWRKRNCRRRALLGRRIGPLKRRSRR